MATVDLDAAIRALVADEVERTLEPYRHLLDRMAHFVGAEAPRRSARPARVAAAGGRPGRGRGRKGGRKADAGRFHEGQLVRYKQGRGEFEAKVLKVDADNNSVFLERVNDGKKVERPAHKIYEAA